VGRWPAGFAIKTPCPAKAVDAAEIEIISGSVAALGKAPPLFRLRANRCGGRLRNANANKKKEAHPDCVEMRQFCSFLCSAGVYCVSPPYPGELVMLTTFEPSEKRIGEELLAIQEAARKLRAGRKGALAFLKRIGADGWPNSPTRVNGSKTARRAIV